jgi:hypothetical protein
MMLEMKCLIRSEDDVPDHRHRPKEAGGKEQRPARDGLDESLGPDRLPHQRTFTSKSASRMREASSNWKLRTSTCTACHAPSYVDAFYKQYDDLIALYDEKFAAPGQEIMKSLYDNGIITKTPFDERIEWDWFYLWHHEGRRARMGTSMNAPDYAHWHGMYEVAEDFYQKIVPEARELIGAAARSGKAAQAKAAASVLDSILARPEHAWFLQQQAQHPTVKGQAKPPPARD